MQVDEVMQEKFPGRVALAQANAHRRKLISGGNAHDRGIYDADTREMVGRVNSAGEAGIVIELHSELRQRERERRDKRRRPWWWCTL